MGEESTAAVLVAKVAHTSAPVWDDRAKRLFERDADLMRSIAARNEGRVTAAQEDRVQMVFGTPFNAAASALELQSLFATSYREPQDRLLYTMGVAYGQVTVGAAGAEGEAAEIAARIQEASRAGRIWVSRAIADSVKGKLPALAIPRGTRAFKDLGKTVELYELVQGLGPILRRARQWRLTKVAPAWGNAYSAKPMAPRAEAREAIWVTG